MRPKRPATKKKSSEDQFMAASIGDVEWLRQSLKESGGAGDFDRNGLAAIHLAAIHGRLDCLRLLVEQHKCDVNFASSTGWRPVHLCISAQTGNRSMKCLLYLLDRGADHSCLNDDSVTPAHQAAREGHLAALELLVKLGAKLDQADVRGFRPIDMAKMWGHRKCARLLATETWRLEKDQLAKKLQMEKKVTMKQLLQDFERQEQLEEEEQYKGNEAFSDWVQQVEGRHSSGKRSSKETKEAKETKETKETKESPAADLRQPLDRQDRVLRPLNEADERSPRRQLRRPHHPEAWNVSTRTSVCFHTYQPRLQDAYPRDEYTMMPHPTRSYPLRLNARSRHPEAAEAADRRLLRDIGRRRRLATDSDDGAGVSDDASDTGDSGDGESAKEAQQKPAFREQLFKSKSVLDVGRRRRVDSFVAKYRGGAALHLISDPSSFLFKEALGNVHVEADADAEAEGAGSEAASSKRSHASGLLTPQLRV